MPYAPSINQKLYRHPARDSARPIRILHVVGRMDRGGVETWLMHVLRHIDRDRFQMDFLVHTTEPSAYDDELRALGSRLIPCLHPSHPLRYSANFKRILHDYGPYDIVHSHVHHYSGYILRLAEQENISIRIAHSHIDSSALEGEGKWIRRLYLALMKSWITHHASLCLGCSQIANSDLFGVTWRNNPHCQLLYYGIHLTPFQESIDPVKVRSEFNLPANAFVIGHVGRFDVQKNHSFLIEIFAEVARQKPEAYLLLVGKGSLRTEMEQQILETGLTDRVIFAGSRSDVPRLMRGAMDIFLFPSLCEGLPVVLLEAQAAGLPCLISDAITEEVEAVKTLVKRLSLSTPVSSWVKELLTWQTAMVRCTQIDAYRLLQDSPFNIQNSVQKLEKIYENQFTTAIVL